MQKTIAATAIAALLSAAGAANAADIYAPGGYKDVAVPAPLWAGFYVGVNFGGAWGSAGINDYTAINTLYGVSSFEEATVTGGGQAGYNWQNGAFVFGVEIDFGGVGQFGSVDRVDLGLLPHYGANGGFIGDITGRFGYALGNSLFYVKGGGTFMNLDTKVDYVALPPTGYYNHEDTVWGWTIGGGIEYKFTPAWSVKFEYLYTQFEDVTVATPLQGGHVTFGDVDLSRFTVGVNYAFGGCCSYAPLK